MRKRKREKDEKEVREEIMTRNMRKGENVNKTTINKIITIASYNNI